MLRLSQAQCCGVKTALLELTASWWAWRFLVLHTGRNNWLYEYLMGNSWWRWVRNALSWENGKHPPGMWKPLAGMWGDPCTRYCAGGRKQPLRHRFRIKDQEEQKPSTWLKGKSVTPSLVIMWRSRPEAAYMNLRSFLTKHEGRVRVLLCRSFLVPCGLWDITGDTCDRKHWWCCWNYVLSKSEYLFLW